MQKRKTGATAMEDITAGRKTCKVRGVFIRHAVFEGISETGHYHPAETLGTHRDQGADLLRTLS